MEESNQLFINAQDQQTIILHMNQPMELERKIFTDLYMKIQSKLVAEAKANWEKTTATVLTNCQEFIDQVVSAISDGGAQKDSVTTEQKRDFMQFIFGTLMQDFGCEKLESWRQSRTDCECFFEQQYVLPLFKKEVVKNANQA